MRFLKYLLAGSFALMTLAACDNEKDGDKDDSYYASNASISSDDSRFTPTSNGGSIAFKSEGGTVAVTVVCGTDWVVENGAADIITATIANSTTLNLTMEQNTAEEARSATISVLTATQRVRFATINVTQNAYGAPEITVATEEWTFPAVSSTLLSTEIGVNATLGTWEVENTAEWLTVQNTESSVILTVTQNDDPEERSTRITLTSSDGFRSDYATIRVYQDARANIVLDKDAISFYNAGETVSVSVEANYEWDFSYDTNNGWFKAEKDGDNLVVTTTAGNDTDNDYEGVITLTAGDGAENIIELPVPVKELSASSTLDALVLDYTVTLLNLEIKLPIVGNNCTVNWGDGVEETVTKDNPTHEYAAAGDYVVRVSGTVTGLSTEDFASSSDPETALTKVEQWGNTGLKTMDYAFYYCTSLKTIPTDSNGAFANIKVFDYAFYQTALTYIPEHLLDYATDCMSFCYTFSFTPIKTAPEDLFRFNTAATDFTGTFRDTGMTSIPENIFQYNINAEIMSTVFYETPITTIPSKTFANCPKITTFRNAFQMCTSLATIPEDVFANNPLVETFYGCFFRCDSLTEIPEDLFRYNTEVTDFTYLFGCCRGALKIPIGLFRYNTKAEIFTSVFDNCTAIQPLPEGGLFANTAAKTFSNMLYTAEIETVPADLFKGCTQATDFSYLFYGSALEKIPEGLFDECSAAEDFSYSFSRCDGLTEYPVNLFKGCPNIKKLTQAFRANSNATSESPYDLVEIDGVETKIHLYERGDHTDIYTSPSSHSSCFLSSRSLADYSDIPTGWK